MLLFEYEVWIFISKIYNYRKSSFLNWIKTSGSLLLLHGSWLTRLKPDAETDDRCVLSDSVRSQK